MPKRVKITLYIILILAIIAVVWLMFWQTNLKDTPTDTNTEALTWEEVMENWNTIELKLENSTFEEDVMKDLEWFFNDNNGYEEVQWEYWFTSPENE